MKEFPSHQKCAAGDPAIARGASRRHLRSIPTLSPLSGSDQHAHVSPAQGINQDVDPDDPPLAVLAW